METMDNSSSEILSSSKLKRRIIVIAVVSLILIIVLYFAVSGLSSLLDDQHEKPESGSSDRIYFYPADYEEDITTDLEYMGLIRDISLKYSNSDLTISLSPDDYDAHGEIVFFMTELINSIIDGDVKKYNESFSPEYFKDSLPKKSFTPQKLYGGSDTLGIRITIVSEEELHDPQTGIVYNKYQTKLEYMIFKNNGTFRDDVGSDGMRPVHYTVSNKSGKLLIDKVVHE